MLLLCVLHLKSHNERTTSSSLKLKKILDLGVKLTLPVINSINHGLATQGPKPSSVYDTNLVKI